MSSDFLRHFFRHPKKVGAVAPLSKATAKSMTKYLAEWKEKKKIILEVGAGTGSVTRHIVPHIKENDHLDLIEIDEECCQLLQEQFGKNHRIAVHCLSILDWSPSYRYDFIFSTLPMSSFSIEELKKILHHFEKLSSKEAILIYVEYLWLPFFRRLFLGKKEREKREILEEFNKKYLIEKKRQLANFLPCSIYFLRL